MIKNFCLKMVTSFVFFYAGLLCAQVQPTLSLDFEDGWSAKGIDGKKMEPRLEGTPELLNGKFGKALKSGPTTGYLWFQTKSILSPKSGTLEMWICPLDWKPDDQKFHVFFDVKGKGEKKGCLYFYKYFKGMMKKQFFMLLTGDRDEAPYYSVRSDIGDWKEGEWHHVAASWSNWQLRFYVDGVLIQKSGTFPKLPQAFDREFRIGDHPWHIDRASSSLIDGVRLFDRDLSDDCIKAHFNGEFDRNIVLTNRDLELRHQVDISAGKLMLGARILNCGQTIPLIAKFKLSRLSDGEKIEREVKLIHQEAIAEFLVKDLKPGDYASEVCIPNEQGVEVVQKGKLTVPSTPWLGNQLGLDGKIPPPWTPLVQKNKKALRFSCWGREYEFDGSPLPTQILAKDQNLLSQPISLKLKMGGEGQVEKWGEQKMEVKRFVPSEVELQGSAKTGKGIKMNSKINLEYDGLMVIHLMVEIPEGETVNSAILDIPIPATSAIYRHCRSNFSGGKSGFIPELKNEEVVESFPYIPFAWVGNNDVGLFWFCESAQNWPHWKNSHAFELVRSQNQVVMWKFDLKSA